MNYSDSVRLRYVLTYGLPYKLHGPLCTGQYLYGNMSPSINQEEAIDRALSYEVDNSRIEELARAGLKIVIKKEHCAYCSNGDVPKTIVSVEVA